MEGNTQTPQPTITPSDDSDVNASPPAPTGRKTIVYSFRRQW